jgi:protoheme IX farnesyltransferase
VPPLVGYAAATGTLGLPALWLFLIVFLWTPPHFWALAILIRDSYAKANIPMLPVVRGVRATTKQVMVYTVALVAASAAPFAAGTVGPAYLGAALGLGIVFLVLAALLRQSATPLRAALVFHYSLLYLALLFVAFAVAAAV